MPRISLDTTVLGGHFRVECSLQNEKFKMHDDKYLFQELDESQQAEAKCRRRVAACFSCHSHS